VDEGEDPGEIGPQTIREREALPLGRRRGGPKKKQTFSNRKYIPADDEARRLADQMWITRRGCEEMGLE